MDLRGAAHQWHVPTEYTLRARGCPKSTYNVWKLRTRTAPQPDRVREAARSFRSPGSRARGHAGDWRLGCHRGVLHGRCSREDREETCWFAWTHGQRIEGHRNPNFLILLIMDSTHLNISGNKV